MIKYGVMTENSHSDFDLTKKAKYYDEEGDKIADEKHKHKLKKPIRINNKNLGLISDILDI